MRLVDLDTKVTTWRYNFDKEEYVAVQTTVGEMIDLNTHEGLSIPIVEIPEPHGRLIDADALHKLFEDQWHYLQVLDWNENPTAEANQSGINWCINTMHDDAPTVIPASEEG